MASARGSPDSRSARASARHSSRIQYRPSTESRCSAETVPTPSPTTGFGLWGQALAWPGDRLVDQYPAANARRLGGHRVPSERRPHGVAPLNGPVQQTDELRARRIRRRVGWWRMSVSVRRRSPSACRSTRPTAILGTETVSEVTSPAGTGQILRPEYRLILPAA